MLFKWISLVTQLFEECFFVYIDFATAMKITKAKKKMRHNFGHFKIKMIDLYASYHQI